MGQQQGEDTPISDGGALDAPRASDEIYQAFVNEPTPVGIDPVDGLPRHQIPHSIRLALAPALAPATFVCMGEAGDFLIHNSFGDTMASFAASEVTRAPNGEHRVPLNLAYERLQNSMAVRRVRDFAKKHDPQASKHLESGDPFLFVLTVLSGAVVTHIVSIDWVQVRPSRPQCIHYARQLTDFTDDPDHTMITRLCTARRTDEGEFLSLRDGRMYACELREPRHAPSEEKLDMFDAKAIAMAKQAAAEEAETFDVDAELQKQAGNVAAHAGLHLAESPRRTQSLGILGDAVDGNVEVADDE